MNKALLLVLYSNILISKPKSINNLYFAFIIY